MLDLEYFMIPNTYSQQHFYPSLYTVYTTAFNILFPFHYIVFPSIMYAVRSLFFVEEVA